MFERFLLDIRADGITPDASGGNEIPLTLVLRTDAAAGIRPPAGVTPDGADPAGERYELRVQSDGVLVAAPGPVGIFRGLTTLRQLMAGSSDRAVVIADGPRYAWRGLSLDVARTFFDVAAVKRVIDMLSLYKFNVLHLHLTDDQGWRIEIPELPRLAEIGGSHALGDRPGGFYSVAQFEDIVSYAAERYVTVVPEVDMCRGHCGGRPLGLPGARFGSRRPGGRGQPPQPRRSRCGRVRTSTWRGRVPRRHGTRHVPPHRRRRSVRHVARRVRPLPRHARGRRRARRANAPSRGRTRRGRARAVATFSSTGSRLIPSWNRCSRAATSSPCSRAVSSTPGELFPRRSEYRSNSCRRSPNTSPRPKRSSGGRSTAARR